jgi:hypothetical protein
MIAAYPFAELSPLCCATAKRDDAPQSRLLFGVGLLGGVRLRMLVAILLRCGRCRYDWRVLQNVGDDQCIV